MATKNSDQTGLLESLQRATRRTAGTIDAETKEELQAISAVIEPELAKRVRQDLSTRPVWFDAIFAYHVKQLLMLGFVMGRSDEHRKRLHDLVVTRSGKSRKARERQREIVAALKRRLQEHPRDSVDYARHVLASKIDPQTGEPRKNWSYSSIRRATTGVKKPKRKLAHSVRMKID
jgi:hypothetical protein